METVEQLIKERDEARDLMISYGLHNATLRQTLKWSVDAMQTWFSSEYLEHPETRKCRRVLDTTPTQYQAELLSELATARIAAEQSKALAEQAQGEVAKLNERLRDALVKNNNLMWEDARQLVLKPSPCGVSGHFAFQLNGGHCMMCQREQRLVNEAKEQAAARETALRALLQKVVDMDDAAIAGMLSMGFTPEKETCELTEEIRAALAEAKSEA